MVIYMVDVEKMVCIHLQVSSTHIRHEKNDLLTHYFDCKLST